MREFIFELSITPRAPYARALPFGVPNNDTGLEMQTLNHSYAHTLVLCQSHSETNTWYIGIQQTPHTLVLHTLVLCTLLLHDSVFHTLVLCPLHAE